MAVKVKIEDIGVVIAAELGTYHSDVTAGVDKASAKAARELAKRAQATAPVGHRYAFAPSFTSKQLKKSSRGSTYVTFNKAPEYRLTHLLVHGHATRDGGRTKANPFLNRAVEAVTDDYVQAVQEVIQHGG